MASTSNLARSVRGYSRFQDVVIWTLQIVVAFVFLFAGSVKLAGFDDAVRMFGAIGFGQWFRYVTGLLEVAGAVLVLVPSFATAGAGVLALVMAGAVVAHLTTHLQGGSAGAAFFLLLVTSYIAWKRREQFLK